MSASNNGNDAGWRVAMQSQVIEESVARVLLLADAVGATSPPSLQEFVGESQELARLVTEHGAAVGAAVDELRGVNLQLRDLFDQIARAREELHVADHAVVGARDHRAVAMIALDRSAVFGEQTAEVLRRLRAELA